MKKLLILPLILVLHTVFGQNTDPKKVSPLQVGTKIPTITLQSATGTPYTFGNMSDKKPLVVVFFRGGWCPHCNAHLSDLQSIEDTISALGYTLLAISPDKIQEQKASEERLKVAYTLLSDSKMEAAKAFGVAYKNTVYGQLLINFSGEEHQLLPVPSLFIIDANGIIRYAHVDADYTKRLSATEVLNTLLTLKK